MIKMILAVDQSGAIGWSDGRLAYRLPEDMKRFKDLTTGGTVVMGHNTYKSLNRPKGLPNRRNIVLSRRPYREIASEIDSSVEVVSRFDWLISDNLSHPNECIWLIGGAQIYDYALDHGFVDEIYMTLVHEASGADVRLMTDLVAWKLFTIREASRGRIWRVSIDLAKRDGDHETTFIHFSKQI